MGKPALWMVTASALLLVGPAVVRAQSSAPPARTSLRAGLSAEARNRVVGYTAWDEDFFYIAVQVNKPTLNAKNSQPFSNPLEDDAVIVSFQTDDDHQAAHRTARSFTVAVSAAGGDQFYVGANAKPLYASFKEFNDLLLGIPKEGKDQAAQEAKRVALLGSLIRYQATPKGAAVSDTENAPGYTVEIAVPWSDLGGRPEPGAKMGFLIAAQSSNPNSGSPPLQSLSPLVKTPADLDNPSLWGSILFSNSPTVTTGGALVCPRVFAGKPVIDGDIGVGEWNGLSSFEFGERTASGGGSLPLSKTVAARVRPDFTPRPSHPPILPTAGSAVSLVAAHHPQRVAPLVLALYDYAYQADTRKAAPPEGVVQPSGATELPLHPLDGTGPWFSYDRADWHRRQLAEVRRAGIDVILPIYRGSARERRFSADKGLTVLAETLQTLRRTDQDYPQVALYLDTNALTDTFGAHPDLKDAAVQTALYGMIRDFYSHIPAPFRLVVPLSTENGGHGAYPVFLSDASVFGAIDPAFASTLRRRFAAYFDGTDLLLLGADNFKGQAALDGYFSDHRDKGYTLNADGWIKLGVVGPGYEETFGTETDSARGRRDGKTYQEDWTAALANKPDWVLLDSWNNFAAGNAVAPTVEAGFSDDDRTRIYTHLFAGASRLGVKFLWHDTPAAMLAQHTYRVNVRAENTGAEGWGSTAGLTPIAFAYRWLRGGNVVMTGTTTAPPTPVLGGGCVNMTIPVQVSGPGNAPLAEGDYTLEISAVTAEKHGAAGAWLGEGTDSLSLQVPVHVASEAGNGVPAWAATLVRSDLPTMLENGSVYKVNAVLRNDGATTWRKSDGARVSARFYKTALNSDDKATGGDLPETLVATADATAELTQDVPPGQEAAVRLSVPVTDPDGKPLSAWNQDMAWTYAVRWEVAADGKPGAVVRTAADTSLAGPVPAGVCLSPMPVAVVDFDFGVRFTADGTLPSLPAERRLPIRLSLENDGPQIWKKDAVRVGYHWYYQDGTEFIWEDETTPLPQDLAPGQRLNDMLAWVTAPPYDGNYWLVWDVQAGDTWASTTASTRPFDESVRSVQVVDGKLTFTDLSKAYNLDGITDSDNLTDGDFDGQGNTFPASVMPPFANAPVAPSGMWLPGAQSGPDSPRRISFRWGSKEPGDKNFIACRGQRVDLGKSAGQCHLLHIVAACTGKETLTDLRLIFQEPTSESEDMYSFQVSPWNRPAARNEETTFLSAGYHTPKGKASGIVALYHYVVTIREPRKLIALILPNAPDVKIAAVTLEK